MKRILFSLPAALLLSVLCSQAQTNIFPSGGNVGIGTTSPHPSALLEVQATNKGVLIPRMTRSQRDAISSPAPGLLLFQTNSQPGFYYYTGSVWTPLISKGPNRQLSNLTAPTAVNESLLPGTNNSLDLGEPTLNWNELYINTIRFMDGSSLSTASGGGAETDPQVGTNTLNRVPRWDGSALVTGKIQDDGSRIGVGGSPVSTARATFYNRESLFSSENYAVRAIDQTVSAGGTATQHAYGYLGYNSNGMLFPYLSTNHNGVWGGHSSSENGAGVLGYTSGSGAENYGVAAISAADGVTNYGMIAKSIGNGSVNRGLWVESANGSVGNFALTVPENGGFSGFGWTAPDAVVGIRPYGGSDPFRVIGTDFATDFIVDHNGKVGVGMDPNTLSATFSVAGTSYISDRLAINASVATSTSALSISGTDEIVTLLGTNPYLQIEHAGNRVGYIRASGQNFQVATNSENDFGKLEFRTNGSSRMWIDANGAVAIGGAGNVATGYLLSVDGKVMCEELRVEMSPWPDYVFEEEYPLRSLQSLREYVTLHNRLPGIPAAGQVESEGLDVGQMQGLLMEKIEELTLYILQLDEENRKLQDRLQSMER